MNNKVISLKREIKDDYNYRESLKTLRTNIQFCGSNIHTIMFTSALPDEGKSDIAFSVAASFAQIGKKVIFIDADIRKSVLVSRYQLEGEVNGLSQYLSGQKNYVNLLKSDNTNLDIVLMFFKTLSQLSDLDIRVLKSYSYLGNDGENILDICKDIHIDFEQMRFIREKLERFGLLQSKNEEINDNNLEEIVKYLQNLEKESKKSKPGTVKIPKLKKVSGSDSYKITPLGRQYLTLIEA